MEWRRFLIIISIISASTIALFIAGHIFFPRLEVHAPFSFVTIALFVIFCLLAFAMGKRAVKSTNKYRFIHILLMIIMGKMVLSLFLVLAYVKLLTPPDKLFVIPFFLIYLVYTAFEIYFLEKVAKEDEFHDVQSNRQ